MPGSSINKAPYKIHFLEETDLWGELNDAVRRPSRISTEADKGLKGPYVLLTSVPTGIPYKDRKQSGVVY